MANELQLRVDEKVHTITASPETPLLYVLNRRSGAPGTAFWMWPGPVWVLFCVSGRSRDPREVPGGVHQPYEEEPRLAPRPVEIDEHFEQVDFREVARAIRLYGANRVNRYATAFRRRRSLSQQSVTTR